MALARGYAMARHRLSLVEIMLFNLASVSF